MLTAQPAPKESSEPATCPECNGDGYVSSPTSWDPGADEPCDCASGDRVWRQRARYATGVR